MAKKVACFTGEKSKISMEGYTNRPVIQLYTGNKIEENRMCKEGAFYFKHSGVCLETQAFPNSLKYTHFPNGILRKNEKYDSVTVYKFIYEALKNNACRNARNSNRAAE